MFNLAKLDVWNKAIDFADVVYTATKLFPAEEKFGLTGQLRRASVSVSSNLAEASGSLFEVVSQSHVAKRQNFQQTYSMAEELSRMLSGLRGFLVGK